MKKKIVLSLPKPCTETWDQMLPQADGRHCTACSKTVIDFTTFRDDEFVAFFQHTQSMPCGRFAERQLSLIILSPEKPALPFPKLCKYVAAGMLTTAVLPQDSLAEAIPSLSSNYMPTENHTFTALSQETIEEKNATKLSTSRKEDTQDSIPAKNRTDSSIDEITFPYNFAPDQNQVFITGRPGFQEKIDFRIIPSENNFTLPSPGKRTLWQRVSSAFSKKKN